MLQSAPGPGLKGRQTSKTLVDGSESLFAAKTQKGVRGCIEVRMLVFFVREPRGMIEAFYWQSCEPSQILYRRHHGGIHGGTNHQRLRQHRASLEKNSHGVETYKFFQNWLRVPRLGPGGVINPGS